MKVLQVVGLTLIVAAVFMHFSFCCWKDIEARGPRLFLFIYARDEFKDSIAWAGVWGLVIPTLMTGGGAGLISHTKEKRKKVIRDRGRKTVSEKKLENE